MRKDVKTPQHFHRTLEVLDYSEKPLHRAFAAPMSHYQLHKRCHSMATFRTNAGWDNFANLF